MVFPHGLVVRCQEKGWMNEDLVKDWLNTVWSKVGGLSHRKSMLVWDSFRAHLSNPVRRTLQSLNTECAVIPGGMTGILQPLDVSINKPFKDHLRNKWQQWMISGEHTLTASGRMRKAELNVICNWIKQAWDEIPTEMIQKSFLKCCITNALDGTEDDDVWEEEDEDPFENLDEPEPNDDELFYADTYEKEQAGIEPVLVMSCCENRDALNTFFCNSAICHNVKCQRRLVCTTNMFQFKAMLLSLGNNKALKTDQFVFVVFRKLLRDCSAASN